MQLPHVTYQHPLPGAGYQAVHGADRPECAAMAALASCARQEPLLGAARGMTPVQAASILTHALAERGIPESRAHNWVQAINGRALAECAGARAAIPTRVGPLTPSDYQVQAILDMNLAGSPIAMAVGLGKTVTSLAAAVAATRLNVASRSRLWIFAPLNAMGAWKKYLGWAEHSFDDVRLVSIDSAHKLIAADRQAGGVLIIDEAHLAGHYTARRTKALFQIRYGFDVCYPLTATLLHAGVEAAMNILDLAIPGASGFATRWRAGECFNCLVKKDIGPRTVVALGRPGGEQAQRFLALMNTYAVTLTKHSPSVASEITIPEQDLEWVEIGGACEEDTDDCIARVAISMIDPKTGELPHAQAVMHACLWEGSEQKLEWILENMDGTPVVLLAEYHVTLSMVKQALGARGVKASYVDGSVTGDDRIEEVRKFQAGETSVFLGQVDAAGASIDLFRSHISVLIDPPLRATSYAQALGRTCRRGQEHHCTHIDLIANPLQAMCVRRLRAAEDFHLQLVHFEQVLRDLPPS